MEISDELCCLFSGRIEQRDDSYVIEIPDQELSLGALDPREPYRVGILSAPTVVDEDTTSGRRPGRERTQASQEVSVEEGDVLDVEIEDMGDQGDGIARIGPGFVVFVPDTTVGDHVTVEIRNKQPRFAFGEVIEETGD